MKGEFFLELNNLIDYIFIKRLTKEKFSVIITVLVQIIQRKGDESMFSIIIKGGSPIYEQLCKRVTELISTGIMQKDEKLPPVREVAKQLGVNPNTVQKAYQTLEHLGLIYSVPAKGSYVSSSDEGIGAIRRSAMKSFTDSARYALTCGIERQALTAAIDAL